MNAACVKCSVLLNEVNPISAAPCGHVFHLNCLQSLNRNSAVCPQCNLRTNLRSVRELHFNFLPKYPSNSSNLENEIADLKAQLWFKEDEFEACKREKERAIKSNTSTEKVIKAMEEHIENLENEVSALSIQVNMLPELEKKLLMLRETLLDARNDMENACQQITKTSKVIDDILENARIFQY